MSQNQAVIHLDRLIMNLAQIKEVIGPRAFFCPMIKANGYGHGILEIAKACVNWGVPRLGVMFVDEALELREAGVSCEIIIFGRPNKQEMKLALNSNCTLVIHSLDQIQELVDLHPSTPASIHVKFDTGMNRLGCPLNEAEKISLTLAQHDDLRVSGVFSHLFAGGNLEQQQSQSDQLKSVLHFFPGVPVHLLNTPGFLVCQKQQHQPDLGWGCRIGGGLYGLTSGLGNIVLRPVMTLKSQVIHIQILEKGERVSYNGSWQAQRRSIIGVVPFGYADGYPRALSNKGTVLVKGAKVMVVGNVCMDFLMIDITDVKPPVNLLDEVILWGEDNSVNELAQHMNTTPYQLTSCISPKVKRTFIEVDHG